MSLCFGDFLIEQSRPPLLLRSRLQLFLTFFKTLEGKVVTVEMKSDLQIRGTLVSVDQYLNLKLDGVSVVDPVKFPQLVRAFTCNAATPRRCNSVLDEALRSNARPSTDFLSLLRRPP